jgi:hypothetical protein
MTLFYWFADFFYYQTWIFPGFLYLSLTSPRGNFIGNELHREVAGAGAQLSMSPKRGCAQRGQNPLFTCEVE